MAVSLSLSSFNNIQPKVTVEWLMLLPRIREVPRSDIHPKSGYPGEDFGSCHK
jgi:hypothetical protein